MNQQQLKAIERFKKAYVNLEKVGLKLFLQESNGYVCKIEDVELDEHGWILTDADEVFDNNNATYLDITIENFNA